MLRNRELEWSGSIDLFKDRLLLTGIDKVKRYANKSTDYNLRILQYTGTLTLILNTKDGVSHLVRRLHTPCNCVLCSRRSK